MFGCVKFFILFFCCFISFGSAEYAYIEDTNTHQLDMDSFWAIAHKIDKHVIIELYTSAAWCSKNNYYFQKIKVMKVAKVVKVINF